MSFLGIVMPSTRSKKPSAASAAAQEPPVTPTPAPNRQRKRTQKFDSGVNPTSKKPKKQPKSRPLKLKTKAPATSREPLKAPQASQFAAAVQAEEILAAGVSGDDDEPEVEEIQDPYPEEVEEVAGDAAAAAGEPSADKFQPVASVRYRAAFVGAKEPLLEASDCREDVRVRGIMNSEVWRWVDDTLEKLKPRAAAVVTLAVTVYPVNQHKGDRRQKLLVRDDWDGWASFIHTAKHIGFNNRHSGKVLCVDFDLILREVAVQQPQQPAAAQAQGSRARPITATMIQEHGLTSVMANEQVASGKLLALQDRWRCTDPFCGNYKLPCWLPNLGNRMVLVKDHHPVPSNCIAPWLEDEREGRCTIDAPSDRVKIALITHKRELITEEVRSKKPPTMNESLQQMQQMLLMN